MIALEIATYEPGIPAWIDVAAPDPAAAVEFYSALFGWQVDDPDPDSGYRICRLRDVPVAGISPWHEPGAPAVWTSYIAVADADATRDEVVKAGGRVALPPTDVPGRGRMAVFVDPANAAFAIWQPREHPGAGLVNEPGTLRRNELYTRDHHAALTFYNAVFGWGAWETTVKDRLYFDFKLYDRTIASIQPMDESFPSDVPSNWLVNFDVEDVDKTVERAASLGGQVVVPPTTAGPGRFAMLADNQGGVFALLSMDPAC